MFASSRIESMITSNDIVNLTDANIIQFTLPTILNEDNENLWENIKVIKDFPKKFSIKFSSHFLILIIP